MASIAFAFPLLPGKADAGRRFAAEVLGPRRREWEESERRLGITRENWYLQPSPNGDMVIVYFEASDPAQSLGAFSQSQAPFDLWFKQQVQDLCGVDMNQPPAGPPPEAFFEWSAS
ncbi:MAG TPA: hypothetical protein VFC51_05240 [Chloroflexota bacterium]|nr:hypothetical protein [Chloroflexota bacterium]